MTRRYRRMAVALLVLGVAVLPFALAPAQAHDPTIEPEAQQILKRMTDYMGSLEKFSMDTDNMLEDVLLTGQKIQFDFTASIQVQRPNMLRAERMSDAGRQSLVYDGEFLEVFNRDEGYFAAIEAPPNIDELLVFARDTLDIVPPSGDMMFTNSFELLMASVTEGFVVGKSLVGGVLCDHLAFRTPLVDWQIWIADGDQPLPHKYVLTTMDDPAHPQYLLLISNWNVEPEFDASVFKLDKPDGATEIDFLLMGAGN